MMLSISELTCHRLVRIYKQITGLDPYKHYHTNDLSELINLMINEIGDLLGIK